MYPPVFIGSLQYNRLILGILPITSKRQLQPRKHTPLVCNYSTDNRFSALGNPNKIWAISSIHAEIDRLMQIHDAVFERISPGDRLVYLGNYTGFGHHSRETVDELLIFRRLLMAQPGMKADDIVYLRGAQEDLWQKLERLQ